MKLTQNQKDSFKEYMKKEDWEGVHGQYDKFMRQRVKELDPEFYDELNKITEGATFWYA